MGKNEILAIRPLSNRIRIVIKTPNYRKKLFQVQFLTGEKGFQLLVQPYVKATSGLLSLVTHKEGSPTADLLPGGKVTQHIVKYSHPIDGNAHFSQTGKIFSKIRTKSKSLTDPACGQIFTAMCYGLNAFQDFNPRPPESGQDVNLEPSDSDVEEKMIRLTAFWYHSSVVRQSKQGLFGPKLVWVVDGRPRDAFVLAPNTKDSYLHQCMIMLSYELIDPPPEPSNFSLLGGFPANFKRGDNQLLVMSYPAGDTKTLIKRVGSVDFLKNA